MALVAGVDSSTQSCKVVVCDADTGHVVRQGRASHPAGTEVDPEAWWQALQTAAADAGGLEDVSAVAISGQQHGMVCLDADGQVIRPALLWNDTRSADAARDLVTELGAEAWAEAIGSVPVASFTLTKLRWLADHEPENAARVAAVALPHDWLTWRALGGDRLAPLDTLGTDRSEASGTAYFDSVDNTYRRDLLSLGLRRDASTVVLPRVHGPAEVLGRTRCGKALGAGCGDNAGAALGLGLTPGQVSLSLGTSGVVAAVSETRPQDATGLVTGFADATGRFLPMATTLNGSQVLDATARMLGVDHDGLSALALAAAPGADGLVMVPYLAGERTPNLPDATGSLHGLTQASATPQNLARAAVEGLLCLLAEGLGALRDQGVRVDHVSLVGGGARSEAIRALAPSILQAEVVVPEPAEYVARGAARQAAWVLAGGDEPPDWPVAESVRLPAGEPGEVLERYRAYRPWSS